MVNATIKDLQRILDSECQPVRVCSISPPALVGQLETYKSAPPYEELIKLFPLVKPGGRYTPYECISRERVAIIIPFRDREEHLRILLHNLHPILQRQQLDYGIYVIEQINGTQFNRAMLMNIGYAESIKLYNYTCFVFHDVDLIPENDRIMYDCIGSPRHLSCAVDKFKYRLPYVTLFGGVTALKREHFEKVNGHSNKFFGWGGEDDDMFRRLVHHGFNISRYPMAMSRYKMIKHRKNAGNKANKKRHNLVSTGKRRYKYDGINKLLYNRLAMEFRQLHTRIIVSINETQVMSIHK
ncbi:beta-1,4-N-acetylgalactosaminyltransferase bre-4-like [Saccostrea cucullata]|uniref:beta-1,4-N-acetylgalactosaminyltransferase bre-4-like n=1 Tax=Saccostrea cuccullata TaxID=36930 RepID=UPI002ED40711